MLRKDLTKDDVYALFCNYVTGNVPVAPIEDCRFYRDYICGAYSYRLKYRLYGLDFTFYLEYCVVSYQVCISQYVVDDYDNMFELWSFRFVDYYGLFTEYEPVVPDSFMFLFSSKDPEAEPDPALDLEAEPDPALDLEAALDLFDVIDP